MPTFNRSFNGGGSRAVVTDLEVDPSDSTVSVDETNNRLGIGTTTPGTQLELDGETPYITLKNSTAENTDGGCETKLIFEDHAAASLGQIEVNHSGSADDTKGKMILSTHDGSSLLSAIEIKEGDITKLGQDSATNGQFLKYDGAKWVADTVSGTVAGSVAADDITAGDAAINLTTTTGNITIDAQAGDSDIIFKGTDGSSDITALTLDMSEAGAAAFNAAVSVGTDLTVTGGDIAFGATNSSVTVGATAHDAAGANLTISAGPTTAGTSNNQAGGSLTVSGGQGKGTGAGGDIVFKTANAGTSGDTLNSLATALTIDQTRKATFTSTSTNSIAIDQDYSITSSSNLVGLDIDIDKTGASGSGSNNSIIGINLDMDNTSATDGTNQMTGMKVTPTLIHAADAGTTLAKGIEVVVTGGTPGGSTARALDLTATGADFNQGIYMAIANGGPDIKMVSSADSADSATIETGANGALTITTTDGGAAAADLTLEIDGDILLNSEEGKWRFKKGLEGSASGRLKIDEANSGDVQIELAQADKKLEFKGTDGSSAVTALELDMALAGKATFGGASQFNGDATFGVDDTGVDVRIFSATTNEGVLYDASEDELGLLLTTKLKFHDIGGGEEIFASADGHLEVNAGTTLDMTAPTVDVNASTAITLDTPSVTISSATSEKPDVVIKNTTNDANGARLQFVKDKGAAGADGDDIGVIEFVGDDAAQTQTSFAKIVAEVSEADDSDEAGKLSFFVAESDGTTTALTAGLVIEGEHATDGQVNVTLGAGVQSVTNTSGKFGVFDTTPMTAINVVNNYNTVTFENQLASGEGGGRVMRYSPGADDTLTVGKLYFLHTDGTWDLTDADAVATGATQLLGIGLGNARTAGCLMEGFIRIPSVCKK